MTLPPPPELPTVDVVLHTAAWTDVDGAEADPQEAAAVNVGGTQHAAELGVATRALLDGLRLRRPQARAVRRVGRAGPLSVYGRTKLQSEAGDACADG